MTPEQVKQHFGAQTQSALAAKLGKPVSTVAEWFQRGRVPRAVQLELQIRTAGHLKANQ
jgi:DNA-binding transcriptional regulator YiaG